MIIIALWVWLVGIPIWVVLCGVFSDEDLAGYCAIWPLVLVVLALHAGYDFLYRLGGRL
jgi:hypothetical protein